MDKVQKSAEEKAKDIYMKCTSYAPYKEMNGISREWFEKKIAEGLEEYASQKGNVWVKAETKPEYNVGVLVFIPDEDYHITSGMWDISNKWVLLDEYRVPECEVTHWMKIPDNPKGFEREKLPKEFEEALKHIAKDWAKNNPKLTSQQPQATTITEEDDYDFLEGLKTQPLYDRLKVVCHLEALDLITNCGFRENKYWTDAENELSQKLSESTHALVKSVMRTIAEWEADDKPTITEGNVEEAALKILCALLQNPERYKYISEMVESGDITQEQANQKNISKAFKIAKSFKQWQASQVSIEDKK